MTALIQENGEMNLKERLIFVDMKGVKVTRRDFTVLIGGGRGSKFTGVFTVNYNFVKL